MNHSWTKDAVSDVNNKKWRKWCKIFSPPLFKNSYGLPVLRTAPNVQIKYFVFDFSICCLFVLNTDWKRDFLQMRIFVNVCSTWSMVELKMRFETRITSNDVNGASLFYHSYLITLTAILCHNGHQMFKWIILCLVNLQTICVK
jgi:hypothetical protein